jgi:hypothetical protein
MIASAVLSPASLSPTRWIKDFAGPSIFENRLNHWNVCCMEESRKELPESHERGWPEQSDDLRFEEKFAEQVTPGGRRIEAE